MKPKNKKRILFLVTALTILTTISTHPAIEANKVIIDETEYLATRNTTIKIRLEYRHSVELTNITEEYHITNCEIRLAKFVWPGYGAGLPSKTNDTSSHEIDENKNYVVRNITLNTTVLRISMKHRINPKLTINGEEVVSSGEVVVITCTRISLIELLTSRELRQLSGKT